jgi:diaminopimelate epimerase
MKLVKAHAYGNDFLLLAHDEVPANADETSLARALCDRHRGVGADGLIIFQAAPDGASMRLMNADGSPSEISGNGIRCLAAWLASARNLKAGASIAINTDAGRKVLDVLSLQRGDYLMRAAMGQPEQIQRLTLHVHGTPVDVVTMRVGNPQCVVLGDLTNERLNGLASELAVHPHFPEGTNVELASVDAPDRVRILIWERGVGPTQASGTGACAAAVAAIQYGGASRDVQVVAPGGAQRVEWRADGLYLTGSATIVADISWLG